MYVTYGRLVCCLDSLAEGKQKLNFLAVFSLADEACGHYFALLDILPSSEYLILPAAISDNGVCVCVEVLFMRTHNIDSQLSLCFHLLLLRSISQVELLFFFFRGTNTKWLTSLADGR